MTDDEVPRSERIGPYRVLDVLGEGGMGVVHLAEQLEPVRRRVALKILKPGMDTAEIVARFEAERQALALMEHPGIAKVLGAGATEAGRPWFAMELVRGVPITEYCDAQRLPTPRRLRLFVDVCQGVLNQLVNGLFQRFLLNRFQAKAADDDVKRRFTRPKTGDPNLSGYSLGRFLK